MYNPKIPLILARKPIFIRVLRYVLVAYKTDLHYWDTGEVREAYEKIKERKTV